MPATRPAFSDLTRGAGGRLKATRLALGYRTQTEFADALGIQSQRLNQWEQEKYPPDLVVMCELKHMHSVPLDWIFMGDWAHLPTWLAQAMVSLGASEDAPPAAVALRAAFGRPSGSDAPRSLNERAPPAFTPFSSGFREEQAAFGAARKSTPGRRSKPR